jgi:hypothetical protein
VSGTQPLERGTGIKAAFWLNYERNYRAGWPLA